jgi:hypothetical protein
VAVVLLPPTSSSASTLQLGIRGTAYTRAPVRIFDERCLKSGDTIIDFTGKTISSSADRCQIYSYSDALLIDPVMDVVCNETRSTKGLVERNGMYGPPGFEILGLKRIDDKTIFLQKTHNGQLSEPGHQVSYCGEAQRR